MRDLASWLKAGKDENKDEPWARLAALSRFALCGFGQFDATMSLGVYNKKRKNTTIRPGTDDKERLRGLGMRALVGNRIATDAASLQRGALSPENVPDEVMGSDFTPWSLGAYDKFRPIEKKMGMRKKQGMSIEKFAKASRRHTLLFSLRYGKGRASDRIERIKVLGKIHEERPEIPPVDFIVNTFEEMNFRYIAQIREGDRKIIRLGGEGMRKPGFARISLRPVDGGWHRLEYHPTSP